MEKSPKTDPRLHLIHPKDDVIVALEQLPKGLEILIDGQPLVISDNVRVGFKVARRDIAGGANVLKYGMAIGRATRSIRKGELVHTHNLVSTYDPCRSGSQL